MNFPKRRAPQTFSHKIANLLKFIAFCGFQIKLMFGFLKRLSVVKRCAGYGKRMTAETGNGKRRGEERRERKDEGARTGNHGRCHQL